MTLPSTLLRRAAAARLRLHVHSSIPAGGRVSACSGALRSQDKIQPPPMNNKGSRMKELSNIQTPPTNINIRFHDD